MSDEKHPYRTPIITGVITAAIWSVFPGWSWTFRAIRTVALSLTWRIPLWLIILLLGLGIVLFGVWRRRVSALTLEALEETPEFYQYDKDRFFDAVWRWSYSGAGLPRDAASFCPNCDMQLAYHESHGPYLAAGLTTTRLICERCNEQVAEMEGDYNHLERRVLREIERRIRTGEYRTESSSVSRRPDPSVNVN